MSTSQFNKEGQKQRTPEEIKSLQNDILIENILKDYKFDGKGKNSAVKGSYDELLKAGGAYKLIYRENGKTEIKP